MTGGYTDFAHSEKVSPSTASSFFAVSVFIVTETTQRYLEDLPGKL